MATLLTLPGVAMAQSQTDTGKKRIDFNVFVLDETGFARAAATFLQKHCYRCHGGEKQEADFRIDTQLNSTQICQIAKNDLDVMNFVKSDFIVINERLARFYGIDSVKGDESRRVSVQDGVLRGGTLTQASMLTTTSNGTRTSPVNRGT